MFIRICCREIGVFTHLPQLFTRYIRDVTYTWVDRAGLFFKRHGGRRKSNLQACCLWLFVIPGISFVRARGARITRRSRLDCSKSLLLTGPHKYGYPSRIARK